MIQPSNWSRLHGMKQGLSLCREHRGGVLDQAWQPFVLIGDPPPLRREKTFVGRRRALFV